MVEIKCPSCGSPNVEQIDVNKFQCPYCGNTFTRQPTIVPQQIKQSLASDTQEYTSDDDDNPSTLMNVLCFLIPILGLIMYFVKKDDQPYSARSYIQWAGAGFIVGLIWQCSFFDF